MSFGGVWVQLAYTRTGGLAYNRILRRIVVWRFFLIGVGSAFLWPGRASKFGRLFDQIDADRVWDFPFYVSSALWSDECLAACGLLRLLAGIGIGGNEAMAERLSPQDMAGEPAACAGAGYMPHGLLCGKFSGGAG